MKSRELLELKTTYQLLKGKYDSIVQRQAEDSALRENRREEIEKKDRDIDAIRLELSKARERSDRADEECSRLRVEIGRIKSEKASKEIISELREIQGSNSSGGKLELVEEVTAKQAEIERLGAELNSVKRSLDDSLQKIKGLEGEVGQLQVALAAAKKSVQTSPTQDSSSERQAGPPSNSRGSFLGGTGSSNAATQFMLLQKDNEIRELNEQLGEAKREISETQSLAQRLTKMLEETQSSAKEREKRLQQRLEVKDSEIGLLQRDMLDKAEALEYAQRETAVLETKTAELEHALLVQKEEFQRCLLLENRWNFDCLGFILI